jgi:hypothetical protein
MVNASRKGKTNPAPASFFSTAEFADSRPEKHGNMGLTLFNQAI